VIFVGVCFPVEARWIRRSVGTRIVRLPMGERAPSGLVGQAMDRAQDMLLSIGFSGGLDSKLRTGDVILARTIRHRGDEIRIDERILTHVRTVLADAGRSVAVGTIVCTDYVASPDEKRSLGRGGTLAADMETGPLARWASEQGIGFLAVRSVLDTVDQPIVFDGKTSVWRSIVRRPGSAIVLGCRAFIAGRALGGVVNVIAEAFHREDGR
jgi:hypothetical protein